MSSNAWIGVDLDGTLAEYHGFKDNFHIGAPVPLMVDRVKAWLREGKKVKIFTARVANDPTGEIAMFIMQWCLQHIGVALPVVCFKDYCMVELWDDRVIQVKFNTGERVGEVPVHG